MFVWELVYSHVDSQSTLLMWLKELCLGLLMASIRDEISLKKALSLTLLPYLFVTSPHHLFPTGNTALKWLSGCTDTCEMLLRTQKANQAEFS